MTKAPPVLAPMLRKLMKWSALPPEDQCAVLDLPFSTRSVRRGNCIMREGDEPDHCSLLISGFAYRHKTVGDGGRQILAVHMPADIVDLQNALLRTSDHSVQALSDATIADIPRDAVRQLAFERPRVGQALWYETLVDGSLQREWTANLGRRSARARTSHLLCEIGLRLEQAGLGHRQRYELPMTQEELADALGLTSVHVNRTLRALSRDGLTQRQRNSVSIADWDRLALEGDFSPDYLHFQDQQSSVEAPL